MTNFPQVPISELILDAQSGFASGKKDENGIAQIRMNNVTTDGRLNFSAIRRVPRDAVKKLEKYQLKDGDVLFNATNSPSLVGKTALFVEQDEPFAFSNHFIRLLADPKQIVSSYLARWLTFQQQRGVFEMLCTRWVNQAAVRKGDLLAQKIPLPPMAEQRRIAAILDKADRLRAQRRAALAKLDTLLQAAFLDMFGDPDSNFPKVKVETVVQEGKGKIRTGPFGSQLLHSEFIDDSNGVMVLGIDNAVQNRFVYTNNRYISHKKYDQLRRYTVNPDDVLITIMGTCGRCSIVPNDIPLAINTKHLCCITPNQDKCLPIYLKYAFLIHSYVLKQLGVSKRGAVMPGLNMGIIKNLTIPLPPVDLQAEFVGFVVKQKKQNKRLSESNEELDNLFHVLQQRAFKGQL